MSQTYPIKTGSFTGEITLNETIVGSTGNDDLKATGQITKNVSVSQLNGQNVFQIGSVQQPFLDLEIGRTYIFDQSDSSNKNHPLKFSTVLDGTHGGGQEYSVGVSVVGIPGEVGAYTKITPVPEAPSNLSYYCANHSRMGNELNLIENMNLSQVYTGQNGVDSGSLIRGESGDDTIVGGPGADVIIGGPGNDILSGGDDVPEWDPTSNTYVFNPGDGHDTITDFKDGFDVIVYEGFSTEEMN